MSTTSTRRGVTSVGLASVLATALFASAGVATTVYLANNDIHLRKLPIMPEGDLAVRSLPRDFPSWRAAGVDQVVSKEGVEALGTDNYLTRTYIGLPGSAGFERVHGAGTQEDEPIVVQLHLAYYTGMVDTVPHVPERCFVGAGTQMTGNPRVVEIPFDRSGLIPDTTVSAGTLAEMSPGGEPIYLARSHDTFRRVRLPANLDNLSMRASRYADTDGSTLIAGYFFIANGEIVPSADQVRLKAFQLEDDYAFYKKVQFTAKGLETEEELAAIAGAMLEEMFADLMRRTPDWVEVREGRYPPGATGAGGESETSGDTPAVQPKPADERGEA